MKKIFTLVLLTVFLLAGCQKKDVLVYNVNKSDELKEYESEKAAEAAFLEARKQKESKTAEESPEEASPVYTKKPNTRERVRAKGIYLTAAVAGSSRMDEIISHIDQTELNAVVIDIKDDNGRIAYEMDSPLVRETGAAQDRIKDMPGLIKKLKEHGIYTIARLVTFRDPYLAEAKPEWMMQLSDGKVFYDRSGMAWVNPYKQEFWDYMVEIGEQCREAGFDEIQFDYVRFCAEKGALDVVYDEADRQGREKADAITGFVRYVSDRLTEREAFVSADVFGTIIGSYVDTVSVGQDYAVMAGALDYICPMVYPSHYGDGNFGIAHPDLEPYRTIIGAMQSSKKALSLEYPDGAYHAIVRPWLQGFTATWLNHYKGYQPEDIRAQIQAVYDSGYDEWIIWNAANNYDWDAFLTEAAGREEDQRIRESREAEVIAASRAEEAEQASIAASIEASVAVVESSIAESRQAEQASRAAQESAALSQWNMESSQHSQ